jgi:sulfur-carrier protein
MLSIHYFASVREKLSQTGETLELPHGVHTTGDLAAFLALRGGAWAFLTDQHQVLVAVDQSVADRNHSLKGHEEVAFFPPMTGG